MLIPAMQNYLGTIETYIVQDETETPSNLPHARRRMLWLNPEIQLPITTDNTHMHMHTP